MSTVTIEDLLDPHEDLPLGRARCPECRQVVPLTSMHIEHNWAKCLGGTDDEWNLCARCNACHQPKTDVEKNLCMPALRHMELAFEVFMKEMGMGKVHEFMLSKPPTFSELVKFVMPQITVVGARALVQDPEYLHRVRGIGPAPEALHDLDAAPTTRKKMQRSHALVADRVRRRKQAMRKKHKKTEQELVEIRRRAGAKAATTKRANREAAEQKTKEKAQAKKNKKKKKTAEELSEIRHRAAIKAAATRRANKEKHRAAEAKNDPVQALIAHLEDCVPAAEATEAPKPLEAFMCWFAGKYAEVLNKTGPAFVRTSSMLEQYHVLAQRLGGGSRVERDEFLGQLAAADVLFQDGLVFGRHIFALDPENAGALRALELRLQAEHGFSGPAFDLEFGPFAT